MKSLPTTLAAGYLAIAVQTLTGLVFIPFLVSEEGVGLAGFAAIATLQAAAGLITFFFDGYRQYAARAIALALPDGDRDVLHSVFVFTLLSATAAVVLWLMVWLFVYKLIGMQMGDIIAASLFAVAYVVAEQLAYVLECHEHALKRSWIPSSLGGLDSLFRAVLTVILFKAFSASVSQFFLAAFVGQVAKLGILFWLSPLEVSVRDGKWVDRMGAQYDAFVNSLPLALNGIAPYMVFRGGVILASVALVGEQAGVVAIILVTLRTYINQGLFSVLRPMLIPRLALVDIRDRTSTAYQRLNSYLDLFHVFTLFVGILAVVSTPWWFSLWLGPSVEEHVGLAQVAVAVYFLEIAYGVQYSCLIAHNNGRILAQLTGFFAVIAIASTAVGTYYSPTAAFSVGPVMAYVLSYVVAVRLAFGKHFDFSLQQSDISSGLFVVALSAGIGITAMIKEGGLLSSLLAGALFWGLSHAVGIRISLARHFPGWKREAVDI